MVIRPSFRSYKGRLLMSIVLMAILATVQLWSYWRTPARGAIAIFWAAFAAIFGVALLMLFRRAEIKVSPAGTLTRWNLIGMAKVYAVDEIGGMARRDVDFPLVAAPTQYVVVYDKQHRCLFKMDRPFWDPEDVGRLHSVLGGESKVERVSSQALADEFPHSVPWVVNHPFVPILLGPILLFGVFVGVILVADAVRHG